MPLPPGLRPRRHTAAERSGPAVAARRARAALTRGDLIAIAALFGAVLLWDLAGLDLAVVRYFGDAAGFRWRDAWWASQVLHSGARAAGWGVVALMAFDAWRPLAAGPSRRARAHALGVTLACAAAIAMLKALSQTSCPWDLAEFGGQARHVSHWAFGLGDGGPGHCFPSGHASTAFALLSGYFLWRRSHPAAARAWLAAVVGIGLVLGAAQLVRGAHYPSHTLWTAWLCWTLAACAQRWRAWEHQWPLHSASTHGTHGVG